MLKGAGGHARVSDELRAVVELLANRLPPWLERVAQPSAASGEGMAPCTRCSVCALIAALRGDRSEVVGRLVDHAAGLLAAARELLTPPAEPTADGERASRQASGRVMVQHIEVRPGTHDSGGAAGC
ncbi:MAG: hypothetical protein ABR608_15260 [Pseudonocardiaceae bacterium]